MIIKKTNLVKDITQILSLQDDHLEKQIPCDKGEWVQWLVQNIENDRIGIWTIKDDNEGRVKAYVVAVDAMNPPISDSVVILYSSVYSSIGEEGNQEVMEKIKEWSRERGAKKITIQTWYPRIMSTYGFVEFGKEEGTFMRLDL